MYITEQMKTSIENVILSMYWGLQH